MEDNAISRSVGGSEENLNIIINEVDGLPNLHPNLEELQCHFMDDDSCENSGAKTLEELVSDEDLPMSVIVTNVDPRVFKCDELKVSTRRLKLSLF